MRAKEGDAYPLGALPIGTKVHCVEQSPGVTFHKVRAAGTFGTIVVRIFSHKLASSNSMINFDLIEYVCFSFILEFSEKSKGT